MKKISQITHSAGLLIRIDDITEHMNWKLMDRCEKFFLKHKIKPVLGVIPKNQDEEFLKFEKRDFFWKKVKDWQSIGWEISMHGYTHIYDTQTAKKDFFGYGGRSEFFGHSFEKQNDKIKSGLKIFKDNDIKIRSFFAPNHTYDTNTFKALKNNSVLNVIDGYGLTPYSEFGLNFIPQLFYKEIILPYGIQTTQMHLNYMNEKSFDKFEEFVNNNLKKIINFETALDRINNTFSSKITRLVIEKILKTIRLIKN